MGVRTDEGIPISIHVPAWGTTVPGISICRDYPDFNPRSRVGNDSICSCNHVALAISIHVPAWGTTPLLNIFYHRSAISIHVPAWGTTKRHSTMLSSQVFQSTFPRGERLCSRDAYDLVKSISIHVPAWGTTPFCVVPL